MMKNLLFIYNLLFLNGGRRISGLIPELGKIRLEI